MLGPIGTSEFDELITQPIRPSGPNGGDIGIITEQLMGFPAEEQDLSNFTFGDDGYEEETVEVQQESTGKESTGRWTREEHLTFIKGLELYGKGWKKIASLIKTRTVVQIRTHAQKYFLKLSKARQNGEHHLSKGMHRSSIDGVRKRRPKKSDRPLALCPAVKHYFQKCPAITADRDSRGSSPTISNAGGGAGSKLPAATLNLTVGNQVTGAGTNKGAGNSTGASIGVAEQALSQAKTLSDELLDAESGLFNFLSPVLNSDDGNTTASDTQSVNSGHSNNTTGFHLPPPSWYVKGAQLANLLKEAEGLDWGSDRGIPSVESIASFTTSSSTSSAVSSPGGLGSSSSSTDEGAQTSSSSGQFKPWNLVQQQQLYRHAAATSLPGTGQTAHDMDMPLAKKIKLEPGTAAPSAAGLIQQQQQQQVSVPSRGNARAPTRSNTTTTAAAAGASASASAEVSTDGPSPDSASPMNEKLMEQMLSNQLHMQRQINELRNEARQAQQGQGQGQVNIQPPGPAAAGRDGGGR